MTGMYYRLGDQCIFRESSQILLEPKYNGDEDSPNRKESIYLLFWRHHIDLHRKNLNLSRKK
jgi:hypothetical protein